MFEFLGDIFDPMFFYALGWLIFLIWILSIIIALYFLIRGEKFMRDDFDDTEVFLFVFSLGILFCGIALYLSSTEYLNSIPF